MAEEVRRASIYGFEITSDDTVLDVGSGGGNDCVLAGGIGADVIAVDISRDELDGLQKRMGSSPARSFRMVQGNCDEGPIALPDGVASVVLAKEVMEHVGDPRAFLADLHRLGRPGARYFISVPDPASESLMRIVADEGYWKRPHHLHVFGRDELDRLVEGAGLRIERRAYVGFDASMWWCLRMAIGTDYYPGHPGYASPPPILANWENVWRALAETPRAAELAEAFDKILPKSQIVIARKPAAGDKPRGWKSLLRRLAGRGRSRTVHGAGTSAGMAGTKGDL